jgi:DNA invertase Pin-like site-specific DNA recombinase
MVRAVGYGRLSRKDGGLSVERQEEHAAKIAAESGWELVTVLKEWVPASLLNKPPSQTSKKYRAEWRRLIDGIHAGEWDAVIFWMADRSARHVLYGSELVDACKAARVTHVHIDDTVYDFTDPLAEAKYLGEVAGAQEEVAKMAKRIRAAKLALAEDGQPNPGGRRPFGFTGTGRNRVSVQRALAEQDLIKEAAARVIAGDSLRGIVADWNTRGIKSSTNGPWLNRSLRQMLLSPRIAGYRSHHGRLIETTHWTAILDCDTWEQVRAILTDPSRTTRVGGGQPRYLLVGMVYCGACDARLRVKMKRHRADQPQRYLCYYCPSYHVSRSAKSLEDYVLREFFNALAEEREAFSSAAQSVNNRDPIGPLRDRQAVLTGLLDRLEDKVADELIKPETAKRKRAEYEREWDALAAKIAQHNGERVRSYLPRNLIELWPSYSLDRQRAILAAVFQNVRILIDPQDGDGFDESAVRVVPIDGTPA